jgi:formylglycine-generating enzyme
MSLLCLSLGLALAAEPVTIPAGTVAQGSPGVPDAPPRTATVSTFRIDTTEVSIADFARFAHNGGYQNDKAWSEAGRAWLADHPEGHGAEARAAGRAGDHPVVAVTWYEADAYCRAAGGALPTEAQWDRAACGDGDRRYPWGDDEDSTVRWYDGGKFGYLQNVNTAPVSEADPALASPFGLVHAAGNVWEWTADWYDRDAWAREGDAEDPTGPAKGTWKALRGGSYMNLPSYCTCSHREPARPDRVAFTTGFRCAYPAK